MVEGNERGSRNLGRRKKEMEKTERRGEERREINGKEGGRGTKRKEESEERRK